MTEIRSLEREDLPAVAALLRANLPGWSGDEHFLAVQTIDHPWADEAFSSLVAVDEAKNVIGFIGAQVRRMRLDGAAVRGVCCTQLAVDHDSRNTAAGAFLLKRMISGAQELTWSDGATDPVVRMWGAFGGHAEHSRACDWMLVLRPARWVGGALGALARRRSVRRNLGPVAALPFQAAGSWIVPSPHPDPPGDVVSEEATTAALVESLPAITSGIRFWVDHDEAHLDHMFRELEQFYERPLVRRLVRHRRRPIGWYAYMHLKGAVAHVLHLAANERQADAVLGELVAHARDTGTAVLAGRAEPHLAGPLSRRFAVLGFARHPVMHATDPKLGAVLATGSSLLTRLDGEPFTP
ncbi:MAG: hypothetical protein M3O76_01485 [Actinomycetota bacterium]|nr:hypothetical protein [Actinomycetota bacterium]